MLTRPGKAAEIAGRIAAEYAERSGKTPTVLVP
jgi:hypothetical protein